MVVMVGARPSGSFGVGRTIAEMEVMTTAVAQIAPTDHATRDAVRAFIEILPDDDHERVLAGCPR